MSRAFSNYDAWKLRAPEDDQPRMPAIQREVETYTEIGDAETTIIVEAERDTDGEVTCLAWWHKGENPKADWRDPDDLDDQTRERVAETMREIDA